MAAGRQSDRGGADREVLAEREQVEPEDLRPDAPDLREAEAPGSLPEAEQPSSDHGVVGGGSENVGSVGTPAYDEVPDLPGAGSGPVDARLEAILNAEDTSGGLDGRNDAQFGGGGATDPNAEAPSGGLEGAAGKVPEHVQAVLDNYNAEAREAAAKGDYEEVDKIAGRTHQFLIDEGIKTEPAESAASTGEGTDLITNFGSLGGGQKQVWDTESGEVKLVDSTEGSGGQGFVTEVAQMQQTGTAASGDGGEGTAPPKTTGANEDRGEDSEGLPDHVGDPSDGIDDEYQTVRFESATGGDVDPDPNADYDSFGGPIDDDPTDYAAEYEQDVIEPDEVDPSQLDPHIDWEF